MKKIYLSLLFIICINAYAFSQYITETIPEFAENLFEMNRMEIETFLPQMGFRLLPEENLIQSDYDENTLIGYGNRKIICIVYFNDKNNVNKVCVNNVKYANFQDMISEFAFMKYIKDEENSTEQEVILVKRKQKYDYIALVNFMINPYACTTYTCFIKNTIR